MIWQFVSLLLGLCLGYALAVAVHQRSVLDQQTAVRAQIIYDVRRYAETSDQVTLRGVMDAVAGETKADKVCLK